MHIRLPTTQYGFYPEAFGLLLAIEDNVTFHAELALLHPADIFCSTFEEFAQSTLLLTRIVNEINLRPIVENLVTPNESAELSHLTQNLYLCADNFINGCRSVLRCAALKSDSQNIKLLRNFDAQIRLYNDAVSKTINYIKHRHRRIRSIYCTSENFIVNGYFVEGVVEKGMLGPDPDMHKDSNCAISFNRDIPLHVANMFLCAGIVGALSKDAFGVSKPTPPSTAESPLLADLLNECSKLQNYYFDDEIDQKRHPRIVKKSDGSFEITISDKNKAGNARPHLQNFHLSFRVPHKYRSFKLPYMRGR